MAIDVYFFMSQADLHGVLAKLDNITKIQFVPSKRYPISQEVVGYLLSDLPELGRTTQDTELQQDSILILPRDAHPRFMEINHGDGTTSYLVGPAQNPDSLIMWPAGEWNRDCILRGRFRVSQDTPKANRLEQELKRVLRKECVLHKSHFLGKEALQRHQTGARLALSVRAPAEYDFHLPNPDNTQSND